MDLFKLAEGHPKSFPDGYRFSWIAFDPDMPNERILFDCHDPKGPHVHIDNDPDGDPIEWTTLDNAYELFFERVRNRFGEYEELP